MVLMGIRERLQETVFNICIRLYILRPLDLQRSLSLIEEVRCCIINLKCLLGHRTDELISVIHSIFLQLGSLSMQGVQIFKAELYF